MSVEGLTILCLSGLNAFQLLYWTWTVHKLVNKLMSRNYAEYNYVEKPPKSSLKSGVVVADDLVENEKVLNELNAMVG